MTINKEKIFARNNVKVSGRGTKVMLFAHGFGCDQNMWRFVAPAFEDDYKVILFDNVGAGRSEVAKMARVASAASRISCRTFALLRQRCGLRWRLQPG